MDFPGGSITNIRAIDGFSTIYYRIYTDEQSIPSVPGDASSNAQAILRHLSRLKDLELRLRNLDCLVSSIPRRLGLWVFSATPDFENLTPLYLNNGKDEQNRIAVGSSTLKGALNSQLIRRNNAIPLGPRTLYSVVEKDSNNSPGVVISDASMVPCLATLQVQLTVIGKLTVSLQTISQPGLMRLRQPAGPLHD
ncbi:hypothetical protein ATERTT37_004521 [Aspergillus terreus]